MTHFLTVFLLMMGLGQAASVEDSGIPLDVSPAEVVLRGSDSRCSSWSRVRPT